MANSPPIPAGYKLMKQLAVTPAMTAWALQVLKDTSKYPMFSTEARAFDRLNVLARDEWHLPDFQNHAVHRGVTLYAPTRPIADAESPAQGIDVSGYQPIVDWSKVAASGVAFAAAKEANLLRGAYHFFRPKLDAVAQARFFLAQLGDPGELPPVLDVEAADGVALDHVVAGIGAWLDIVIANLGRPVVYTSPSFWNALPAATEIASKADLWVANWGARSPAAVHGWPAWTFWQFTNKATISGIPGTSDMDEDRFGGSLSDLRTYSDRFIAARPCSARSGSTHSA